MLRVPNVTCAVIFDRTLGCADESATDDELKDKILFFHPRNVPLSDQLTKVYMLEGLIEFSNTFSAYPLDQIVMRDNTWGFYECEKDIWIAISLSNTYSIEDQHIPLQLPNATGLVHAIKTLYSFISLYVVHRRMRDYLNSGWSHVLDVMAIRKKIRKLRLRTRQEEQDLESMKQYDDEVENEDAGSDHAKAIITTASEEQEANRFSEQLGIRQGVASVQQLSDALHATFAEITTLETKLDDSLSNNFVPKLLSNKLTPFMIWYLGCGELLSPSFLHVFNGIHYAPMARTCLPLMLQAKYGLEDALGVFYKGCTYLYNGQVALCSMDNEDAMALLYNYIRLKEATRVIDSANEDFGEMSGKRQHAESIASTNLEGRSKKEDKIKRIMMFGRRSSSILASDEAKADAAVKSWVQELLTRTGFINRGWRDSEDLEQLVSDDVLSMTDGDDNLLWCPEYLDPLKRSSTSTDTKDIEADRCILYRHGRFIVMILVSLEGLKSENALPLLMSIQENLNLFMPRLHDAVEATFRDQNVSNSTPPPPQLTNSVPPREKNGLRIPHIRIFYSNDCVNAIKISGSKVWTPSLPKSFVSSPSGGKAREERLVMTAEQLFQDPLLYSAATRTSLLSSADLPSGVSELSAAEVNAILALTATGAFKFSNPAAHSAVSIHPDVLSALNGLSELLIEDKNAGGIFGGSRCREACTRVSAVDEGGKWVFGRARGYRRAFVLVEGCTTLNEMYSVINDIFDGILGSVMI